MKEKKHYFDGKLHQGFISLYTSKSIIRIAGGLFGVFLPVFLYEYFNQDIKILALWYLVGCVLYFIFLAWGAIFMSRFGFRNALRLGSVLGALFFVSLYFADASGPWLFIFFSLSTLTLHRIFHWIPYHIDFAKFTDNKNRGREVGLLEATTNVIGVLAPFAAGIILSRFNFDVLFVIAIVIYLVSILPLLTIPKTHEKFSWTYAQTWRELFSKKRRKIMLAHFADGSEQSIGLVIWPIFIFELLHGNYFQIGTLAAFVTGATILLQLVVGKYTDSKIVREHLLKYGSILYSIGWIVKIFVATAFHIFIADAYHRFVKIFMRLPFDALTYESTSDAGHFVDELTVLNEMSLQIGKASMFIAVIILASFISINLTFILAAVASILLNFIRTQRLLVRN